MSKYPRKRRGVLAERACQYCGRDIPHERPVFLIAEEGGKIVGPFHAQCAAHVVARQQASKAKGMLPGMEFGRVVPNVSQEELPW
jgi:hypothetical protein